VLIAVTAWEEKSKNVKLTKLLSVIQPVVSTTFSEWYSDVLYTQIKLFLVSEASHSIENNQRGFQ